MRDAAAFIAVEMGRIPVSTTKVSTLLQFWLEELSSVGVLAFH